MLSQVRGQAFGETATPDLIREMAFVIRSMHPVRQDQVPGPKVSRQGGRAPPTDESIDPTFDERLRGLGRAFRTRAGDT